MRPSHQASYFIWCPSYTHGTLGSLGLCQSCRQNSDVIQRLRQGNEKQKKTVSYERPPSSTCLQFQLKRLRRECHSLRLAWATHPEPYSKTPPQKQRSITLSINGRVVFYLCLFLRIQQLCRGCISFMELFWKADIFKHFIYPL